MRVILRENIENLGKKGDIVKVAPGYGRNFLIPKKMAVEVTPTNAKMIAIEQAALQKGFEQEKSAYGEVIERLNQVSLSFTRKTSEKDVIFGSVSSTDIRDALANLGFEIEKKKIILDEPIKRLGHYTIPLKIFHEERAEIKIEVAKEGAPPEKPEQTTVPKDEAEAVISEEPASAEAAAEDEVKTVLEEDTDKETAPEETPAESQETERDKKSAQEVDTEKREETPVETISDNTEEEEKNQGE